jgi:hypothetical protein
VTAADDDVNNIDEDNNEDDNINDNEGEETDDLATMGAGEESRTW